MLTDGYVRQFVFNMISLEWREGVEVKVEVEEEVREAVLCQGRTTAQLVWSEQTRRRRRSRRRSGEVEEEKDFIVSACTVSLGEPHLPQ